MAYSSSIAPDVWYWRIPSPNVITGFPISPLIFKEIVGTQRMPQRKSCFEW
jgi:hypothetical protein